VEGGWIWVMGVQDGFEEEGDIFMMLRTVWNDYER
jgi:hypothetical protein